jgi:glycosyltransferase involved in cell wall biosynthesis
MKVLMVTPGFYPITGGTETIVQNLSIELTKIGVHTDVMTFNMDRKWNPKWRGKTEKINDVTVYKIPALKLMPSSRMNLRVNLMPGSFTNLLKRYDIIHFHEIEFSFPLFSYFARIPKILHLHGINKDYFKRYALSRLILKNVSDYYICITSQQISDLIELGIARRRIVHLPNSVNVKLYHPSREKEDNLILYVGRIVPIKGLHVLIKSLEFVKKSVHLVIVGPIGDVEYYQDVLKIIDTKKLQKKHKIIYLGRIPQAELLNLYKKASIFMLPSFWEAFPVVMLEALSCGTPVIATPVGGIPEVIQDFQNGILIPVNNPVKLADAIQYLLDNADIRTKLGQIGRETILKNYSIDVITKRLLGIYEKIV